MSDLNLTASRRNFIKAAGAALALGAGTAMLGGCSPKGGSSSNDAATSVADIKWDDEYDVIVVGGGIAGLAAAATVASEGEGKKCSKRAKTRAATASSLPVFACGPMRPRSS